MDDFRFVKTDTAASLLLIVLLPLLLLTSPGLAASLKRAGHARHAKLAPVTGFHHYGYVCGQKDAHKGQNFSGSLTATHVELQYMNEVGHRQELPKGQALALVHLVEKANAVQRQVDLKAFLDGYMVGWEKIAMSLARPARAASKTYGAYGTNDPALQNLRVLGEAVRLYLSDHNMTFPRMIGPGAADKYFRTYLLDDRAFYDPRTKEPYQPNFALENVQMGTYQKPGKTVVYYEVNPEPDGSRAVLFLDGSVAHIPASQWPALKEDSGISDPQ